jgi:arsenate reductase
MQPIRVLVLCTNNSARSQMAEGFFRQIAGGQVRVDSAGTAPSRVHPLAIQVMQEFGVDLAQHTSKHLNQFLGEPIDVVLTVCDAANDTCPMFPGRAERLHWSYPDPGAAVGEAAQLEVLREIGRDMQARVRAFVTERGGVPQELGAI